jgi:hypothetical protein
MKKFVSVILTLFDVPDKTILFDQPVMIRKEGVSIFECWGAALVDSVWLMDERGDWYELSETDANANLVIEAIHQKLKELLTRAA